MPKAKVRKSKPKNEGSEPHDEAAYFLSLELRNVRCFGDQVQTLDLSDGQGKPSRWTILLGNNGTGKTTILQSLASFVPAPIEQGQSNEVLPTSLGSGHPNLEWLKKNFIRNTETLQTILTAEIVEGFSFRPSTIAKSTRSVRLEFEGRARSWPKSYRSEERDINEIATSMDISSDKNPPSTINSNLSYRFLHAIPVVVKPYFIAKMSGFPPVCYGYGALRRLGSTSLRNAETSDRTSSLFRDDVDLVDAEEWLLRLDYSASKPSEIQEQQVKRRDQVKDLLLNILPEIDGIRFAIPTKAHPNPTVEFQTHYAWVPLRHLSHGYQTMIAWMVDLASRMVDRYPDSPDPLAESAVVLVDELDLHLHPAWQRKLIDYLTERFPNTQFIATAHSPLIAQAASDANIALLKWDGDHVLIENHMNVIKNMRVDQILTSDLFGLKTARPPQRDGDLKRRQELLTRPKLSKAARKELDEIEARIGTLPTGDNPAQIDLMNRIDATLKRLEDRQGRKG